MSDGTPSDEELLDSILAIVKQETLLALRGIKSSLVPGDVESDAIKAASVTMLLLLRRQKEKQGPEKQS